MGDDAALDARARQMQELALEGRNPSGSYRPALARGSASFERGDFSCTIEAPAPNERIGGSRAQHDLIRLQEAKRLLDVTRPGHIRVPVMGIAAVH